MMLLSQFNSGSSPSLLGNGLNGDSATARSGCMAPCRLVPTMPSPLRDSRTGGVRASAGGSGGWLKSVFSGVTTLSNKVGSLVDREAEQPGKADPNNVHYKATILISKKLLMNDLVDHVADLKDDISEHLGHHVSVQLVSNDTDPKTGKPILSQKVAIQNWVKTKDKLVTTDFAFNMDYYVPKIFGVPGAIIVKNEHPNEFHLKDFRIALPDSTIAHYATNSWVYNTDKDLEGRIFFHNKVFLPSDTPTGLKWLRELELQNLRGDGTGLRIEKDRIYDYEVYNELGKPDENAADLERPNLGGNSEFPYPRRCRTGRPPSKYNPKYESREKDPNKSLYIPRDERYDRVKNSDIKADTSRAKINASKTVFWDMITMNHEFDTLKEVRSLYEAKSHKTSDLKNFFPTEEDLHPKDQTPLVYLQELVRPDGQVFNPLKYPLPKILHEVEEAWDTDEQFAGEFLAGLNPVMIRLVEEFPIKSKLVGVEYGDPVSAVKSSHIADELEGLDVKKAVEEKRLFVADYHDTFLPWINKINAQKDSKTYASRALFFLTKEQTLKVLALELVLPPPSPGRAKISRVFFPPKETRKNWEWALAKAHVNNNDIFVHQIIIHFTRCHACAEPYLLATNRQLSKLHPVNQLLKPHFKNTLETNTLARSWLICAKGVVETSFTPQQYAQRMSSVDYRNNWTFNLQALPEDLINRGMAVRDPSAKHGVKLVVDDYPYAADGLEYWIAINSWNTDYIDIYYKDDQTVLNDSELQQWWTEIRTVGHADKKDSDGWPMLESKVNLVWILSTIQWVVSCQHAAVNFGQYHYGGFYPHHPTFTRRLIPERNDKDWEEFQRNPELFYLSSLSSTTVATSAMSVYSVLSAHSPDEEYIGQRADPHWTENEQVKEAFKRFQAKIKDIDELILARNADESLKNRKGLSEFPYELQRPFSPPGMTGMGIPNSISI